MHQSLTLRAERWTPDGTQDVIEPRRGALCCSAIGMAAAKQLPTSTQDVPRCHTYELRHAGVVLTQRKEVKGSGRMPLHDGRLSGFLTFLQEKERPHRKAFHDCSHG